MRARIALAALCAALLAASWACCARELQGEALDNSQLLGGGADGGGRSLAQAAPAPPGALLIWRLLLQSCTLLSRGVLP